MKSSIISQEQVSLNNWFMSNLFNPNYDYICDKCGQVHDNSEVHDIDGNEYCPKCGAVHDDHCWDLKQMDRFDFHKCIESFLDN